MGKKSRKNERQLEGSQLAGASLAERLAEARQLGAAGGQIAAAAAAGISQPAWNRIEKGQRLKDVADTLRALGDAVGMRDYRELLPP
jgi:transcriptional regulator with XRE-family HTH domain